jgi:apolipoprotein N-acyltransferase
MAVLKAWPWAAAALSGVLLTLCFPPWNQGWLCWFALTPLIAALFFQPGGGRLAPLRQAALGYVTGLVFFPGTFFWLSTTLSELYSNQWLLALTPLLALFLALYLAFWAWFVGAVLVRDGSATRFPHSLRNLGIACAGASAWLVHEWVRERLFGGFGWNPVGVALSRDLPMIQIAELTGVPGLSFLVVFTNLMAVIIVRRIIGELGPIFLKRIRWEFSFTMALIAAVFVFGLNRLFQPAAGPSVGLRVVAVQPNIAQTDKFDPAAEGKVLAQIKNLTSLATLSPPGTPPAQLVLWPESAIPSGMFASEENFRFVIDQLQDSEFALLLGTTDLDPKRREDFNTALLLTDHGRRQQSYRKMHLVPFGEYLPLRPVFEPFVGQLVPGDFTPGREHTLLELNDPPVKIGALVCFEDTLGDLTRQFAKAGAHVLVNITNDGWFARSPATEQHLANAVLRAVENRLPLIRCGNSGATCLIKPTGHLDRWLPLFEQGFAAREVRIPTQPRLTFYARHGDWLSELAIAITILTAITTTIVRRRRS